MVDGEKSVQKNMSDHLESYSYQHGSGAVPHHLPSISSSRLRRRSLRISLLPPESEDITLNSINEEDLPEDDHSFDPQADPELPSIYDRHASDYSDNSLSDNPGSQQCHWPSQATPPHSSIASNGEPGRRKRLKASGKIQVERRRERKFLLRRVCKDLVLFLSATLKARATTSSCRIFMHPFLETALLGTRN
jgi:hypothetical protein